MSTNTLVKYNQNRSSFSKLFADLEQSIFNNVWSDPMFSLTRNFRPEQLKEDDKSYTIEIEVPRVRKSEIKCEAIDEQSIQVTINNPNLKYARLYHVSDCDTSKAEVKLEAGVLMITVPKVVPPAPKTKILEIKESV
jgi:HSP20 family molecular chaperone IbpA